MKFLMIAAHDTLASLVYFLAANPQWLTILRNEVVSIGLRTDQAIHYDRLSALAQTEMAFKEAMRIMPPVPAIARSATRGFSFDGYSIPAGTPIALTPLYTHHRAEHWPEPDRFDPTRFTDTSPRKQHRHADVPFGGDAHMCLGLHFAHMQVKCFIRHFLQNLTVSLEPGYQPVWQMWPIPKPKDGLKVILGKAS
jgi:cytochrome P450